ncbi:MAG: ClC family H(+)/Cl(-) exchange transporter [Clostridiales bacterium]|nr:ClC family H(+)/Cl(-) exchange transporter [Clostridiales bacterium]
MRKREKTTIRKLENHKTESLYLIIRGIETGIAAGLVCVLYRFLLSKAEEYLYKVLEYIKGNPIKIAVWLVILAALGVLVSFIIKWEPKSSGSGIPQVTGEIKGYFTSNWIKIIITKMLGSTISIFSGLSLGREGPSVQFGGMAAKGVAKITKADKTTEIRMISCGAGAGLAAAFNAPLAGIMFVLEEIHHTFDKSILCMGIVAAVTADFISKIFFGQSTVFSYVSRHIPLKWYWLLILLGILLGVFGSFYNVLMIAGQNLYNKIKFIPKWAKMGIVFAVSGIVGTAAPLILCGGHTMADFLIQSHPSISVMIFLLFAKFIFGVFSFSSSAPRGTLYPLSILGTYIGAVYGEIVINAFNLNSDLWQEFVVLGMAGLFASIVRAPITGVIIVFEITGNMNSLLPLVAVSLISYTAANMIGTSPFYESLLERAVNNNPSENKKAEQTSEKVLQTFVIPTGSPVSRKNFRC